MSDNKKCPRDGKQMSFRQKNTPPGSKGNVEFHVYECLHCGETKIITACK